ncbi:MAG: hypothetical protein GYB33_14150 [Gammaproteobacteria bacterium]|uniref:hypothetical protein n=1 Tax=Pseudomaricurvus alcaniphilus TaxID=1166482 RepID=UPI001408F963|nr:hypothetical protein [Pseudomaricurvus alcaniphilus]MBR9911487.1 hypothetical protein [Gammaproteobacteria bacterium]NHN35948.1 hypothetical protein [Pseudomaricurvus alcaniphilus]
MPKLISLPVIAALVLWLDSAPGLAETIKIPVGQQSSTTYIERPTLGMDMSSVERKFGPPLEQLPARGEPPISRWVYDRFVVYFEGDIVIHTVVRHQPQG